MVCAFQRKAETSNLEGLVRCGNLNTYNRLYAIIAYLCTSSFPSAAGGLRFLPFFRKGKSLKISIKSCQSCQQKTRIAISSFKTHRGTFDFYPFQLKADLGKFSLYALPSLRAVGSTSRKPAWKLVRRLTSAIPNPKSAMP